MKRWRGADGGADEERERSRWKVGERIKERNTAISFSE